MDKLKKILRGLTDKIYNFYFFHWRPLWIFFLVGIGILNFELVKIFPPPQKDLRNYIQEIYLGFIAFSIPFLWNVYNRIIEMQNQSVGVKIETILNREFYKKADELFYIVFLIPFTIFLLGGLAFSYWLSHLLTWTILFISFFFILFSTKFYQGIKKRSSISLENFIIESQICQDLVTIFEELLQKTDENIGKDFNLHPVKLMNLFTQKIEEVIQKEKDQKFIQDLLLIFQNNFENRLLWGLTTSNFWRKFLEWHLKICRNLSSYYTNYINTFIRIQDIFHVSLKKILTEKSSEYYLFLDAFIKHINAYKEEKFSIDGQSKFYIYVFLTDFCNIFFEEVNKSPHCHTIWKTIPYEWKVTSQNLKSTNPIPRFMLDIFLNWAQIRIFNAREEELDKDLEDVARELFPETEPILWATILIFLVHSYSLKEVTEKVKSVIEKPWTFGYIGRVMNYTEEHDEVINYIYSKQYQQQIEGTIKLLKTINFFADTFSKENLEIYLKTIETLKEEYKRDEKKLGKLKRLKVMLETIKGFNNEEMGS
ncbi:MAG: hypothetical protein NC824_00635 [Candidatus Omnitrophica bacterium]|nr:hypothetical protein [Candidatus Omnitrophota bacterium]